MKPKSITLIQTDRPDRNAATSGIVSVDRDDYLDSTRLQNVPMREDPVAEWLLKLFSTRRNFPRGATFSFV